MTWSDDLWRFAYGDVSITIGNALQRQFSTNSTFIIVRFLKLSKMMMHPTVWNWHNTFQLSTQQQLWANEAILGLNQQKKQKCHHRKKQKCHQQKKVINKKNTLMIARNPGVARCCLGWTNGGAATRLQSTLHPQVFEKLATHGGTESKIESYLTA